MSVRVLECMHISHTSLTVHACPTMHALACGPMEGPQPRRLTLLADSRLKCSKVAPCALTHLEVEHKPVELDAQVGGQRAQHHLPRRIHLALAALAGVLVGTLKHLRLQRCHLRTEQAHAQGQALERAARLQSALANACA